MLHHNGWSRQSNWHFLFSLFYVLPSEFTFKFWLHYVSLGGHNRRRAWTQLGAWADRMHLSYSDRQLHGCGRVLAPGLEKLDRVYKRCRIF